jgi:predicted DNA-binding transcriptional regulator YafY
MINFEERQELMFDYVNWRGEKGSRRVIANRIYFGSTEYHKEPQWIMAAYDFEKKADREFAMKDMSNVVIID